MQIKGISLFLVLLTFTIPLIVLSQDYEFCGTDVQRNLSFISVPPNVATGNYYGNYDYYVVPIRFVIIGPQPCSLDDSVSALISDVIPNIILPELEQQFAEHRICFVNIRVDTICNDYWFNKKYNITKIHDYSRDLGRDPTAFNVYIVPLLYKIVRKSNGREDTSYPSGVSPGYRVFPPYIFLKRQALFKDVKVTSHEIGHSFGLGHTHDYLCSGSDKLYRDKVEWAWTDNFDVQRRFAVSGGECAERGDGVCDTWPVIFTHNQINWFTCKWKDPDSVCNPLQSFLHIDTFRNFVDTVWLLQALDTHCTPRLLCNTMGYVPGIYCRKGFTKGQGARMRWHLDNKAVGRLLHTVPSSYPTRVVSGVTYQGGSHVSEYYLGRLSAKNIVVNSGATVEYSAAYSVVLKPPFHVKRGAKFHAYIEKKCSESADNSTNNSAGPYWENLRGSDQNKIRLSNIEVFPTIIRSSYLLNIRLMGNISGSTITVYWIFSEGSSYPVYENIPIQGQTIQIQAPQQQGLYRLKIVLQSEDGVYEVENVPVLVYH